MACSYILWIVCHWRPAPGHLKVQVIAAQNVVRQRNSLLEGVFCAELVDLGALDKDLDGFVDGFVDGTIDWLEDGILDGPIEEW